MRYVFVQRLIVSSSRKLSGAQVIQRPTPLDAEVMATCGANVVYFVRYEPPTILGPRPKTIHRRLDSFQRCSHRPLDNALLNARSDEDRQLSTTPHPAEVSHDYMPKCCSPSELTRVQSRRGPKPLWRPRCGNKGHKAFGPNVKWSERRRT